MVLDRQAEDGLDQARRLVAAQARRNAGTLTFSLAERETLRGLAAEVASLAARPIEDEKRDLWRRHNALQPTRPLVFCDPENGWQEIIPPSRLACTSALARQWEMHLRKEVFWGAQMRDDYNHTINNDPQRVVRWVQIAREEAER